MRKMKIPCHQLKLFESPLADIMYYMHTCTVFTCSFDVFCFKSRCHQHDLLFHSVSFFRRFVFGLFNISRYNIVFLAFTYGIPMVVMIICYSIMGRELWGSQSIGENTERQTESVKSKKKVSNEIFMMPIPTLQVVSFGLNEPFIVISPIISICFRFTMLILSLHVLYNIL